MTDQPKHKTLTEWIKEQITSGNYRPEDKMISENELARMFSISRHTVRQSIGELCNQGWLERVRGSGTYVKKTSPAPEKRLSKNIGVITTYLDDYIFPSIIQGMDKVLSKNGYSMTLGITYNSVENEYQILQSFQQKGIDGLIVEGTKSALPNPNVDIYRQLTGSGIPCVFINGFYPVLDCPYVVTDDKKGGSQAVEYLISHGHTKIGGIFKSDDMQGHARYAGFAHTLKAHNLPLHEKSVIWYQTEDFEYLFHGDSDKMIISRLRHCSALVCYNDMVAVKLIEILKRNGLSVPENISVISFDDSHLAGYGETGLTSLKHPKEALGASAAQLLLNIVHGSTAENMRITMPVEIAERQSVKNF